MTRLVFRVGTQIAPVLQAPQGLVDLLGRDRLRAHVATQRLGHILGPQMHDEALLGRREHAHHPTVGGSQRGIDMREWARPSLPRRLGSGERRSWIHKTPIGSRGRPFP